MSRPMWDPPHGERPYGERVYAHEVPHAATPRAAFSLRVVIGGWVMCYAIATLLQIALVALFNVPADGDDQPSWFLLAGALTLWVPFIVLLVVVSQRSGTGNVVADYRARFRLTDLWGLPIGVLSQLLLVGLVTWPFREWFPDTFSTSEVEDRARNLYDSATGIWLVVLFIVVVLGAPVVEELVYRGFIQAGLQGRFNDIAALVVTAVWFTVIHGRVAEFPGLFAFALVLGTCYLVTKRLGLPFVAHLAFNATGLALLALT